MMSVPRKRRLHAIVRLLPWKAPISVRSSSSVYDWERKSDAVRSKVQRIGKVFTKACFAEAEIQQRLTDADMLCESDALCCIPASLAWARELTLW